MKLLLAGDSGSKKWNITAPFCNPNQLYPTKNESEALGSFMPADTDIVNLPKILNKKN